jgi:hypothetical protein
MLFLVISCKKKSNDVDLHENYYPLTQGLYVEYDVVEINIDAVSNVFDTLKYVLKTKIGDTIIDNSGRIARKFYRYKYDELFQEYKVKDLWTTIVDQYRAELVEENQRSIKLVFAPTLQKEWDINAFNSYQPLNAYYENIHKSVTIGNLKFDSTVTVIQEQIEPNLIEYRRKIEIYAKNVGLIKKYYKDLTISNFDTLQVKKGTEIYYTIKSFGIE